MGSKIFEYRYGPNGLAEAIQDTDVASTRDKVMKYVVKYPLRSTLAHASGVAYYGPLTEDDVYKGSYRDGQIVYASDPDLSLADRMVTAGHALTTEHATLVCLS